MAPKGWFADPHGFVRPVLLSNEQHPVPACRANRYNNQTIFNLPREIGMMTIRFKGGWRFLGAAAAFAMAIGGAGVGERAPRSP